MKQYGRTVNFAEECALLLFHRDPDLAVVVLVLGAVLKPAGVAIQLHIDACGDLVVGVRGQPLGEDLLVQSLEGLGHPASTGEHRPGMGRDGAGGEAIGDLLGRIVVVGDKIQAFFESEEGQQEFAEWKAQEETKRENR